MISPLFAEPFKLRTSDHKARIEAQLPTFIPFKGRELRKVAQAALPPLSGQADHHLDADRQRILHKDGDILEYFFRIGIAAAGGENGGIKRRYA
ncbi:hypothetical protein SDC9_173540 [bioreactor metagenome]|uniref:Uncharacterized protein n=1 Tax=bioreactor metagenome TaxID=1076179 RepID=A0A645GIR3_9ZZZZ